NYVVGYPHVPAEPTFSSYSNSVIIGIQEMACRIELQLVGGDTACSGRVEVQYGKTWETVCDSNLDFNAASVICNELGCGQAVTTVGAAHFGEGHDLIWKEEFQCVGNESLLQKCPWMSHPNETCSHANDVSVLCSGYGRYRLANGSTGCSGRVELRHGGAWGTLCDSQWDLQAAHTLCQHLDCGFALSTPAGQLFGTGDGPVWNGTIGCERNKSRLRDCPVTALGATECPPGSEANVVCSGCPGGRLVNGTECSGRVEIRHGDTWGSLCDSHWDLQDANVLCHQLNCGYAESIQGGARFGEGSGTVWSDAFHCEGTESCLWNCSHRALGNPACSPRNTTSVICSGANELRLVNGSSPCAGRVEVKHQDQWGTVCDDYWDMTAAGVVCKQLGCGVVLSSHFNGHFGQGSGQIWLDNTVCGGNESALWECDHNRWGNHNCDHIEDVGVSCSGYGGYRLANGSTGCSGRVELRHGGAWGTLCDSQWDLQAAHALCQQLDCGFALSTPAGKLFGTGDGPVWNGTTGCERNKSRLRDCPVTALGATECPPGSEANVVCS
ncbi:scavenger receptor cysteine-rich type 1 protein M130-like, partial [Emydura macquarii macquarii]|uniref:scavenger receptor cysteine-rich type 1 protein M130-like n=1 Tax=Emydura macquarii macquarii TaxID=1129001 RepID=UPI00352BC038